MDSLIIERSEGVVRVTMNAPEKKNAASGRMFEALRDVFIDVERNDDDRAMVLTGAAGNFCTGADLTDPDGENMSLSQPGIVRMRRLNEVAQALHAITKPTIARVDGLAVGAGLSLALGCDLIVASERARFSMIFAKRALSPDLGASWLLPRAVGMAKAKELTLLGDIIDASEALAIGLINRVESLDDLDEVVDELALRLAGGPTVALSLAKGLLDHAAVTSFEQALEDEGRAQSINFATEDMREAMTAFFEKRPPTFTGR
jgi:2-(1,2-epoxy-1,2-dihydrophenyl)acetyl-CoA isomerase